MTTAASKPTLSTAASSAVHYRWKDLPQDRPMENLARRRIIGTQMMLSEVLLKKGCHVPMHAHENEQFACIVSGELRFTIGSADSQSNAKPRTINVKAGEVLHLPSNVPHAADAVVDTLVIDLFSPPSATTGIDRRGH